MKLEDLVDIEKLRKSVTPPDKIVFRQWTATAHEISRGAQKDIASLYVIYMEIPEQELRPSQVLSFIEELVRIMPSVENKKSLLRAEALQCMKEQ